MDLDRHPADPKNVVRDIDCSRCGKPFQYFEGTGNAEPLCSECERGGVKPLSQQERDLATKVAEAMPVEKEMTVDQIAAAAKMDRTTVLRVLDYLVDAGTVSRLPRGKYCRLSADQRG